MQKIKLLKSDYRSFDRLIGKVVYAFKCNYGYQVPVGQSAKYDRHSIYSDQEYLPIEMQETLFFTDEEVLAIDECNPFAFWNKIKSSRDVGAFA